MPEMLPLANRDTVFISIDRLIDKVKKRPENLLALTRMAEAAFYSDSAIIPSDEVYLPFAKAVAGHKKSKEPIMIILPDRQTSSATHRKA